MIYLVISLLVLIVSYITYLVGRATERHAITSFLQRNNMHIVYIPPAPGTKPDGKKATLVKFDGGKKDDGV